MDKKQHSEAFIELLYWKKLLVFEKCSYLDNNRSLLKQGNLKLIIRKEWLSHFLKIWADTYRGQLILMRL